jgi:hypothetical protein
MNLPVKKAPCSARHHRGQSGEHKTRSRAGGILIETGTDSIKLTATI